MQARHSLALLLVAALASGCSSHHKTADPNATPAPMPTLDILLEKKGVLVPFRAAAAQLSFRPFAPAQRVLGTALIVSFRGEDAAERRGIAFEWEEAGALYVLQEWPLAGPEPDAYAPTTPIAGCKSAYRFPNIPGVILTTSGGRILALQADGRSTMRDIRREAGRLVRRGLCRI